MSGREEEERNVVTDNYEDWQDNTMDSQNSDELELKGIKRKENDGGIALQTPIRHLTIIWEKWREVKSMVDFRQKGCKSVFS